MHGCTEHAGRLRQQLTLEDAFACVDERLRRFADVLVDRENQLCGQWWRLDRQSGRLRLVGVEAQSAMQPAEIVCRGRARHYDASIEMQSTGHGATHNSQPVHSCAITVCISWWAPTMASTGQAARQ